MRGPRSLLPYDDLSRLFVSVSERGPAETSATSGASVLLYHEARLLDARRFDEWLSWWSHDGIWWLSRDPDAPDPAVTQSLALDDRRRLGERIARLSDPAAWSQQPPSRTVRSVSNIEAWEDGTDVVVASILHLSETRRGLRRQLMARQIHEFARKSAGRVELQRKIIAPIDGDLGQSNLTFVL